MELNQKSWFNNKEYIRLQLLMVHTLPRKGIHIKNDTLYLSFAWLQKLKKTGISSCTIISNGTSPNTITLALMLLINGQKTGQN
jgi:hypothetical protein